MPAHTVLSGMKDYHINIFYSEADSGYIADIPDLNACSAFGNTPAEALKQAEVAKAAWLVAAWAEKKTIPKPRYRPAIYQAGT
jgi:predicted RNase H-like HicB family nuclease